MVRGWLERRVLGLAFRRWDVADIAVNSAEVEPFHMLGGGELEVDGGARQLRSGRDRALVAPGVAGAGTNARASLAAIVLPLPR